MWTFSQYSPGLCQQMGVCYNLPSNAYYDWSDV